MSESEFQQLLQLLTKKHGKAMKLNSFIVLGVKKLQSCSDKIKFFMFTFDM